MKHLIKISAAAMLAAMFAFSTNAAVKIGGNNQQSTDVQGAILNTSGINSKAIQNISSNRGKVTINGNNVQRTNIQGGVTNTSISNSEAIQNLSSNSSE